MKFGWENKKLGEVSAINYGYTESASSEPVGPRFLRITDIQDDQVDWDSVPFCKLEPADFPKYRLASGDIVFARTGATTGKSFLVREPPDAVFASYLIRLRLLDKRLLPEFVSLYFQTAGYWKSVREGSSGSAQGGFNASKLGDLSIPIPPLSEQHRIVAILDEAFDGIATAKANAEKNLQNARALFESRLQAVFTGRGEGWAKKRLGEVYQVGSSKRVLKSQWKTEGVPFYRGREITRLALDGYVDNELFISEEHYAELSRQSGVPKAGDIVITAIGTIGNSHIVRDSDRFYFKDASVLWMKRTADVSSEFVNFWLKSSLFFDQLDKGSGATVDTLTIQKLQNLELYLPSQAEQKRIASELAAMREETRRLESLYQQKLAALDALKQSLLHQAFSGQLTERSVEEVAA